MIDVIGTHVALRVSEVARSVTFYTSLFGMRVRSQGQDSQGQPLALLELDAFLLALVQSTTKRPKEDPGGPDHIGFLVRSVEEVHAAADELRQHGISIVRDVTNPDNRRERSIYFYDPDRHLVEVYCEDVQRSPRVVGRVEVDPYGGSG